MPCSRHLDESTPFPFESQAVSLPILVVDTSGNGHPPVLLTVDLPPPNGANAHSRAADRAADEDPTGGWPECDGPLANGQEADD